jgi:hypothetical protein
MLIKFIGRKPFLDNLYRSGLHWEPGQTRDVPVDLGNKFLRHADVFTPGKKIAANEDIRDILVDDTKAVLAAARKKTAKEEEEAGRVEDTRDNLLLMDKNALEAFARAHFRVELDKRRKLEDLRQQVSGYIDQYGLP